MKNVILYFLLIFYIEVYCISYENIHSDEECVDYFKNNISNNINDINDIFIFLMKKRWVNCYFNIGNYYIRNKLNSVNFDIFYFNKINEIIDKYNNKQINHYLPNLEFSQNHTHIFIHILNNMNLKFENFNITLSKNHLRISYYINKEDSSYIQFFYQKINLFNPSKENTLYIKEESDYNYIIYFEKEIVTLFWEFLDLPTDNHENIRIWYDMYEKYENKMKFNEYRDYVSNNLLLKNINSYINEKIDEKKNRFEKIKKLEKKFNKHMNEEKNYYYMNFHKKKCFNINKEKQYFNWFYWLE